MSKIKGHIDGNITLSVCLWLLLCSPTIQLLNQITSLSLNVHRVAIRVYKKGILETDLKKKLDIF